jgi:hypothetical protein
VKKEENTKKAEEKKVGNAHAFSHVSSPAFCFCLSPNSVLYKFTKYDIFSKLGKAEEKRARRAEEEERRWAPITEYAQND